MKIALAIPCYNCENQIARVLTELDIVLSSEPTIYQVFLIDNRSSDQTLVVAIETIAKLANSSRFKVFKNVENVGLGGTHKVAYNLAHNIKASHLGILHGDHQASPLDIPNMLLELKKNNDQSVLGSRFSNLNLLTGYSYIRILGNLGLNFLYSIVTLHKITDLGSGLNFFNISDFKNEDLQNFDNGFTFNMDLLLYLIRKGVTFTYTPIKWSTTDQISNARAFNVGLTTLKKLLLWRFFISTQCNGNFKTEEITSTK